MRPYVAVIKDAFREAFVSRVLWIALILLSLVLLFIFPLSYSFQTTTELSRSSIVNAVEVIESLQSARKTMLERTEMGNEDDLSSVEELVSMIPAEELAKLDEVAEETSDAPEKKSEKKKRRGGSDVKQYVKRQRSVADVLNIIITKEDTRNLKSLDVSMVSPEARAIFENPSATPEEVQRFNRLMIEQTFETSIVPGSATSIVFYYLGMKIGGKIAIEKERLIYLIQVAIKYILNFIFSSVGVLMALIITANVIPQTFDPGSLSLLLSKPVSRWKLFIAQFLGGCAFVTLTMGFFFVGIWLFLGMRMGYWNSRLLFYVPSFIGIFAIYYSASAIAGLLWRSPIVSVVAGASLWLFTFVMFIVNTVCETSYDSVSFKSIDVHKGQQIASFNPDAPKQVGRWDSEAGDWEDISLGARSELGFTDGPYYDESTDAFFGLRQQMLMTPLGPRGGEVSLLGRKRSGEKFSKLDVEATSFKKMFRRNDGRVLLLAAGRLHLLEKVAPAAGVVVANNAAKQDENVLADDGKMDGKEPGTTLDAPKWINARSLGPKRSIRTAGTKTALAFNRDNDRFAVLRRGKLSIYSRAGDQDYALLRDAEFDQFVNSELEIGYAGDIILIFDKKLGVISIDTVDMTIKTEFGSGERFVPKSIKVSPDGEWIVALRQNETVWVYSVKKDTFEKSGISREAKAICFDDKGHLHVADRWLRVTETDLSTSGLISTTEGQRTRFQFVYQRIVYPLYYVFPKWGELNYTVEYLVTGRDTADTFSTVILKVLGFDRVMPVPLETYNLKPWPQVWTSLLFIAFMLGIGCVIIERTDY